MKEINRTEVARILSGLKYCYHWNNCNRISCGKNEVNIFTSNDKRIDYVVETMQEHKLSEKDLERLLVAYKRHFKHHEEDEDTLIGKIRRIYLEFELETTQLPFLGSDVCSIV